MVKETSKTSVKQNKNPKIFAEHVYVNKELVRTKSKNVEKSEIGKPTFTAFGLCSGRGTGAVPADAAERE